MIKLEDMIREIIKTAGGGVKLQDLLVMLIKRRDISDHNQEKFAFIVFDILTKKMPGIAIREYSDYADGGKTKYFVCTP